MNLVLLENHEFLTESTAQIGDRKAEHIQRILNVKEGQSIRVGKVGGLVGKAVVASVGERVRLADISLTETPPAKLPVRLVVALPRPKAFRRIIEIIAMMGVPEIIFVNATKVDKAYWNSNLMDEQEIRQRLLLGLEQAGDTILPSVKFERLLKPFVEDRLSAWCGDASKWIAHPSSELIASRRELPLNKVSPEKPVESETKDFRLERSRAVIAIGPEGGWIEYELTKFKDAGFVQFGLGSRLLKVETAVQVCVGNWLL